VGTGTGNRLALPSFSSQRAQHDRYEQGTYRLLPLSNVSAPPAYSLMGMLIDTPGYTHPKWPLRSDSRPGHPLLRASNWLHVQ